MEETQRPPLRRRTDDRVVAGVASGLAAYLNVDPALVRTGLVILFFTGGIGIPLYLAGWLLIPEADQHQSTARKLVRSKGPGFWVGIAILVFIAMAVADSLSFGRGWWPIVLIGAGIALWRAAQGPDGSRSPVRGTSDPGASPALATEHTAVEASSSLPPPALPDGPGGPAAPPPSAAPRRRSGPLGRLTVALSLIAAGVTVLLDQAGAVDAHLGHVVAVPLVVVGLGLVVGAWFGRARGLIGIGSVLVPVVLVAGLLDSATVPWEAGIGEPTVDPAAVTDLEREYRLAAGKLRLLLDRLPPDAGRVEIRAEVGAGVIDVRVPAGAEVRARGRLNLGEIRLFDRVVKGIGELDETVVRHGAPGSPTIVLDLRVGAGEIIVRTGSGSSPSVDLRGARR